MYNVLKQAGDGGASDSTVLIPGRNGTRKELIARAIHANLSGRSGRRMQDELRRERRRGCWKDLLGHERGAYRGASAQRIGRLSWRIKARCFWMKWAVYAVELQPAAACPSEQEFETSRSNNRSRPTRG